MKKLIVLAMIIGGASGIFALEQTKSVYACSGSSARHGDDCPLFSAHNHSAMNSKVNLDNQHMSAQAYKFSGNGVRHGSNMVGYDHMQNKVRETKGADLYRTSGNHVKHGSI
ncbi:MAG: hypothetical protein ACRC4W_07125 [Treponemataceae bacterium]